MLAADWVEGIDGMLSVDSWILSHSGNDKAADLHDGSRAVLVISSRSITCTVRWTASWGCAATGSTCDVRSTVETSGRARGVWLQVRLSIAAWQGISTPGFGTDRNQEYCRLCAVARPCRTGSNSCSDGLCLLHLGCSGGGGDLLGLGLRRDILCRQRRPRAAPQRGHRRNACRLPVCTACTAGSRL